MNWLRELGRRIWMLAHRRQFDADLEEEMRLHLEMRQQEHLKRGLQEHDARAAARRRFGNVTVLREISHMEWGWEWFEHLAQDVRYSLRILRKSPGFAAVAALTLALGIGANTAIFSVIDSVLLSPLPYHEPQQLVAMKQNDSLQNVIDIQRQTRTFSQGGGVNIEAMDYTGEAEPVQILAAYVDAGLLETFRVPPMLGRIITPDEDVNGGPRNIVVSYHFWRDFLGSDPHALGKTIPLSGSDYTVIGVMPANFALPREHADVFVSLWVAYPEAAPYRGVHFMRTYWRLKPGVTLSQAQADISTIDRRLAQEYPDNERERETLLVPLQQWLTGDVRPSLLVFFRSRGFGAADCLREFRGAVDGPCDRAPAGVCNSCVAWCGTESADSSDADRERDFGDYRWRGRSATCEMGHGLSGFAQTGGAGTFHGNSHGGARVLVRLRYFTADGHRLRTHARLVGGARGRCGVTQRRRARFNGGSLRSNVALIVGHRGIRPRTYCPRWGRLINQRVLTAPLRKSWV